MIKLLVTDIDGVLTDGKLYFSNSGEESKAVCFKDLDAVGKLRKNGIKLAIITGEEDYFVETIEKKFHTDSLIKGCKEKRKALVELAKSEGVAVTEVCYIGDGKYDLEAIKTAGIGVCPADAIEEAVHCADFVLKRNGGNGCLDELADLIICGNAKEAGASEEQEAKGMLCQVEDIITEHSEIVRRILDNEELKKSVSQVILVLEAALRERKQVLFCGNGGSAADAQHLAAEFVSRFYMEREALNAEALTVNTSSLTAISNDYSYKRVFSRQIEAKGKTGDILIGISTSGHSENVIEAFKEARKLGMKTIAMVGEKVETVKPFADIMISVPSNVTPRIQEMHIMIGHIICEQVEKDLFLKE